MTAVQERTRFPAMPEAPGAARLPDLSPAGLPGAVPVLPAAAEAPIARAGELSVSVAASPAAIERALRLRHQVFVGELGASGAAPDGIERDIFDPYCRHLVVDDHASGRVVGTYRVLMPEQARLLGCLYADREFWLTRLNPLRDSIVELGRACVHPDYRTGAAIMLLWSGIGALLASCGHRYLLGCVSVPVADGGAYAARLYETLARRHLADETLRVWPRVRIASPLAAGGHDDGAADPAIPPLMRGYLRAGAKLLGEPSRDDAFGCADFPMMLRVEELTGRYQRRFMQ